VRVRDMPRNRSGVTNVPAYGEPSLLELNAPNFNTPEEYAKWLDGNLKRREASKDFQRLGNGMAVITTLNAQLDSRFEALIRMLAGKGVIDPVEYNAAAELQLKFKGTLDSINFLQKEIPFRDRLAQALAWNEEHPELLIHGSYVIGLVDYLKVNHDSLALLDRADIATSLLLDPVAVFSDTETAELERLLLAKKQTASSSLSIPSGEAVGTPSLFISPPREPNEN